MATNETRSEQNADHVAWLAAAKAYKCRIEGDQVWAGCKPTDSAPMLFPVPALPGFASLPPASQTVAFRATYQMVSYRIGQTAEGNVAKAVHDAVTAATLPSAKSNDAFESLYLSEIRERVRAVKKDATPAQIEATAETHRNKEGWIKAGRNPAEYEAKALPFEAVIKAAIAAGQNKPTKGDSAAKKPRKTAEAVEIAI